MEDRTGHTIHDTSSGRLLDLGSVQYRRPICKNPLIYIPYLKPSNCLKQPSAIVASREITMLQHLLSDFSIEPSGDVAEMTFHIYQLIELIKLAIHLQHRYLLNTMPDMSLVNGLPN